MVADFVQIDMSFNSPITGTCAFTKAGFHAKAILQNPSTYEILKPEDFRFDPLCPHCIAIGWVERG